MLSAEYFLLCTPYKWLHLSHAVQQRTFPWNTLFKRPVYSLTNSYAGIYFFFHEKILWGISIKPWPPEIENKIIKSAAWITVPNFIFWSSASPFQTWWESHTPQACSGSRVLGLYQGVRNSSLSQRENILLPSSLTKPPPAKSLLLHCHLVFCCKSNPSQRPIHKAARFPYEAVVPPSDLSKDPGNDLYE